MTWAHLCLLSVLQVLLMLLWLFAFPVAGSAMFQLEVSETQLKNFPHPHLKYPKFSE